MDNTSLEKELDDAWRREKIMGKAGGDDSDVIFKLKVVNYSPLKSIEYKKFPYHESQLTTPSNGKETRNVAGVNTSLKRKKLSPYGEVQVARALKLKKANDPGTPILRERLIRNNIDSPVTPLNRTRRTTTSSTKKSGEGRNIRKLKRCLNPDKKQLLITSIFSPKNGRKLSNTAPDSD